MAVEASLEVLVVELPASETVTLSEEVSFFEELTSVFSITLPVSRSTVILSSFSPPITISSTPCSWLTTGDDGVLDYRLIFQ